MFNKVITKFRYNLFLHGIINRIARIGFELRLFYLVQESLYKTETPRIKGNLLEYSLKSLGEKDMEIIGAFNSGASKEGFISKLQKNEICIGLLYLEEIVAFVWFDFNECNYRHYRFRLKDNEAYLYFLYVVNGFRGKNLAAYLRYHSYDIVKKMGIKTIYSTIQYFNSPAIRSIKKVNGKFLKLILYIGLFKKINRKYVLKKYE